MVVKENGGPAFPTKGSLLFYVPEGSKEQIADAIGKLAEKHEGMSLREWYAGQALASLKFTYHDDADRLANEAMGVAAMAVLIADALITELRR